MEYKFACTKQYLMNKYNLMNRFWTLKKLLFHKSFAPLEAYYFLFYISLAVLSR